MIFVPSKGIFMACGLAGTLHLLLFAAVSPTDGKGSVGTMMPPATRYLVQAAANLPESGSEVRTVCSPVLFSLPSNMGFSRELMEKDVHTRLSFSQQVEAERFLAVDSAKRVADVRLTPQELMLTAGVASSPGLPADGFLGLEKRPAARRVNLAPELKERLVDGVVLPPALNKDVTEPWEIHASVSVSEYGAVNHVFLDKPLKSVPLNRHVLQLLYGLRFKPGQAVDGSIEIYSPEAAVEEVEP